LGGFSDLGVYVEWLVFNDPRLFGFVFEGCFYDATAIVAYKGGLVFVADSPARKMAFVFLRLFSFAVLFLV
jgi:hypothetical protein